MKWHFAVMYQRAIGSRWVIGTTSFNVVEWYHYSPYGGVTLLNGTGDSPLDADQVSDIGNELLYTGRRLDPETGLQYSRHRFYHPQLGRWVNRDPIGYAAGDMNLYGYVGGRPTTSVDPSGLLDILTDPSWGWGDPVPLPSIDDPMPPLDLRPLPGIGEPFDPWKEEPAYPDLNLHQEILPPATHKRLRDYFTLRIKPEFSPSNGLNNLPNDIDEWIKDPEGEFYFKFEFGAAPLPWYDPYHNNPLCPDLPDEFSENIPPQPSLDDILRNYPGLPSRDEALDELRDRLRL